MSKLWLIAMLVRGSLAIENGGSLCFKVDWTLLVSKKIRPFIFPLWQYDISEVYFFRPPCLHSGYPRVYECVKLRRWEVIADWICVWSWRVIRSCWRCKGGSQIWNSVWTAGLTVDCSPLGTSRRWTLYVSKLYVHTDLCSGLSTQKTPSVSIQCHRTV